MAARWRFVLLAALLTIGAAAPRWSQTATMPLLASCQPRIDTADSVAYRFCSGNLASFDGTTLDSDITLPSGTTPYGGYPLLVMMHGWGADKGYWEANDFCSTTSADACDFNNVWFAHRGYAVLTYTARGFHNSQGYTHLSDMRWEVHDTQYLAGLLVDAGVAKPGVGVAGLSYGGGQGWLLAVLRDEVMNPDGSLSAWHSPAGKPLHVAAAVPKYTWTDLVDALEPNGRSSNGLLSANGDRTTPFGIEKKSYVDYFYTSGQIAGRYAAPGQDPSADITTWYAQISAGETPAQSTYAPGIANQITRYRSAYYQDSLIASDVSKKEETPIFAPQGWTDSLFTESQATSMVEKLRTADPNWPVFTFVSDLGHPLADNSKFSEWRPINQSATAFLDLHVAGVSGSNPASVYQEQVVTCGKGAGPIYSSNTVSGIAPSRVTFQSSDLGHQTTSAPTDAANGTATDPIAYAGAHGSNGGCVKVAALPPDAGAATSWSFPVCSSFTLLGEPALQLAATAAGTDAEINSRLWDVAPDGSATLVTRGAYRWTGTPGASSISYSLFGSGWVFAAGHSVRLQVTQNDAPYLRPDNYPSAFAYSSMKLTLPTTASIAC